MKNLNTALLEARKRASNGRYRVKSQHTGCTGIVSKRGTGTPTNLTIKHAINCDCLDVRLTDLCKHANRMVRQGRVQRARKFDLVLALKLRSRLPRALRLRHAGGQAREMADDGEDEDVLRVIEFNGDQTLTEMWNSPEAYRKRKVWQDW
ncbi:hypothetical protein SLS62_003316 [Diatrype stigma]|uniref:SWIM-type domain-containing protein n=1 Tax=Diatrype stigma TaxID=117547 RepID=A0AAN9UWF5_9PEZI